MLAAGDPTRAGRVDEVYDWASEGELGARG